MRMTHVGAMVVLLANIAFPQGIATPASKSEPDISPHRVQFIKVERNVNLEVLDWGGSGRSLVLLAGLGDTAHIFDTFALKLTPIYHVYGITRRGYGASSAPRSGYGAVQLGDDVLTVLSVLKLNRPVLVGHSRAGEELSSVGSRHPERVSALIYLDAGYAYAYYDRSQGDLNIDLSDLQKKLAQLEPGKLPRDPSDLVRDLLESSLPIFERDLREMQKNLAAVPPPSTEPPPTPFADVAVRVGAQKITDIRVPILAIFAVPHALPANLKDDPAAGAAFEARDEAFVSGQAKAFETGLPSARVVRLPHANHYVFFSNEAEVLREMNAFMEGLR
jgi:non-heme chloroperoxidase